MLGILSSNFTKNIEFVAGGDTRFQSVKNGLAQITESAIVFVHDAVRCLLTPALIQRCYQQALEKGSAIPAVSSTDTVRLLKGEKNELYDRESVMLIQTPQTFQSNLLLAAFNQSYIPSFTDEANVIEANGQPVNLTSLVVLCALNFPSTDSQASLRPGSTPIHVVMFN